MTCNHDITRGTQIWVLSQSMTAGCVVFAVLHDIFYSIAVVSPRHSFQTQQLWKWYSAGCAATIFHRTHSLWYPPWPLIKTHCRIIPNSNLFLSISLSVWTASLSTFNQSAVTLYCSTNQKCHGYIQPIRDDVAIFDPSANAWYLWWGIWSRGLFEGADWELSSHCTIHIMDSFIDISKPLLMTKNFHPTGWAASSYVPKTFTFWRWRSLYVLDWCRADRTQSEDRSHIESSSPVYCFGPSFTSSDFAVEHHS